MIEILNQMERASMLSRFYDRTSTKASVLMTRTSIVR